jgi:nicotinate-nucleotide adenylyltransferase
MARFRLIPVPHTTCRIGLLGGSFNPAHEGHFYISIEALKRLKLDRVYWLVTPQNPLKKLNQKTSFKQRFKNACKFAKHPRIAVSDIENHFHTAYTIDTITRLKQLHPNADFIWLMGADNVVQFHRWKNWKQLVDLIPIAIFDRHNCFYQCINSKLASCFPNGKIITRAFTGAFNNYSWYIIRIRKNYESSTRIRGLLKNGIWYKEQFKKGT